MKQLTKILIWIVVGIPILLFVIPLLFFLLLLFINSPSDSDSKFPNTLDRMRIHNSSKVIYSYAYYGDFAFSDFTYGRVPLDSTVTLSRKNAYPSLPSYITDIDMENNYIECISFISKAKPTKKDFVEEEINGIQVKSKQYYLDGRGMSQSYHFYNLTETRDSIFFDSLSVNKFGVNIDGITGFRKYNITVEEDSNGFIQKIEVPILISEDPLNINAYGLRSQIDLPPLSTVSKVVIELIPDNSYERISDYGVYKRVQ